MPAIPQGLQRADLPYVDVRELGGVADGVADSTAAINMLFARIAAGETGYMPPGIYNYNASSGGIVIDCARFSLSAAGATIRCSAYPTLGASTYTEFISIRAAEINLIGLNVDGGWDYIASRVDGQCVADGLFDYMTALVLSADAGFIDDVSAHDSQGQGISFNHASGMNNVTIGKISAHHNWMNGIDLRCLSAKVQNVSFESMTAYGNGTRGSGWVQVNIGDRKTAAGVEEVIINSIFTRDGGGGGVGIGQYANPANSDISGAKNISIGSIISNDNALYGVELYASESVSIGSVAVKSNGSHGLYVLRSDTNDLFGFGYSIGSVQAWENGSDGVLISGIDRIQIASLLSWDNGASAANSAGLRLYAAAGLAQPDLSGLQIGALQCWDSRSSGKTQEYGVAVDFYGQPGSLTRIGCARLSGNNTADIAWLQFGASKAIQFESIVFDTVVPSYADNDRCLFMERDRYRQRWSTTNDTPAAPIIVIPQPVDLIAEATIVGRDGAGAVLHIGQVRDAYKWNGTGFTKVSAMEVVEYKTDATVGYTDPYGNGIGVYVLGLAATAMNWDVSVSFSGGINEQYAI